MIGSCVQDANKRISTVVLLVVLGVSAAIHGLPLASAADTQPSAGQIDEQRLTGRWVRPDGGYVLELREVGKNGTLKAAYFNPQSIKVARAELSRKDGALLIFVELRDVNYPGSTYNLRYDPETDRLIGTYFQAVYGETYRIEFKRAK